VVPTIEWKKKRVKILDQSLLPNQVKYLLCQDYRQVAEAIISLKIRGAPAIGIAAAMGVALGSLPVKAKSFTEFRKKMDPVFERLRKTRPTAVNLFWALDRMRQGMDRMSQLPLSEVKQGLVRLAQEILEEDIDINQAIGKEGNRVIHPNDVILTHCNAGSLATGGYGTALGVIRAAHFSGKKIRVYADETRPVLQGGRLTAWELMAEKIDVTLITDSMAGSLMAQGKIKVCIVGADRIARNGDTANKIGTYSVAVLAKHHGIPFYVAAPLSTIDFSLPSGEKIPIEERNPLEVTTIFGKVQIAPKKVKVYNPAFDVTPAKLITGIITEKGIFKPKDLKQLFK